MSLYERLSLAEGTGEFYLVTGKPTKRSMTFVGPFPSRKHATLFSDAFFDSRRGGDEARNYYDRRTGMGMIITIPEGESSFDQWDVYERWQIPIYQDIGGPEKVKFIRPKDVRPGPNGLKPKNTAWGYYTKYAAEIR